MFGHSGRGVRADQFCFRAGGLSVGFLDLVSVHPLSIGRAVSDDRFDLDSAVVRQAFVGPLYGWSLTLVPEAREAGGCFGRFDGGRERITGGRPDPARSAEEGARRARTKSRRYCAANRLNRLGTLTYDGAGCHDPRRVKSDVAGFWRELRRLRDCGAFPYLWTAEWHKSGHGLHVHFAVGDFVNRELINAAWGWKSIAGRGFTHIKLIGDLPVGSGVVEESRKAAGYLSKYVGKDFDASRIPTGWHRYEVAQGFQPVERRFFGESEAEVLAKASAAMGCRPTRYWSSAQVQGWERPPAVWVQWAG